MPALPDVPAVLRLQYDFTNGTDTFARCRQFFRYTGAAPTVANLASWLTNIDTSWNTNMKSLCATDVTLDTLIATDLTSPTSAVDSLTVNIVGTRAGGTAGAGNCVLGSYHINRRYRGGHPRTYWPLLGGNDFQTAQTWEAASITSVETGYAAFLTDVQAPGWTGGSALQQVNVSYYEGFTTHTGTTGRVRNVSTVRTSPLVDTITSTEFHVGIAAQRKRLLHLA